MKTQVISVLTQQEAGTSRGAEILRAGGLVAFPTETVYGLGANGLNSEAVAAIYAAKGRPTDNPSILHVSKKSDVRRLWRRMPRQAQKVSTRRLERLLDRIITVTPAAFSISSQRNSGSSGCATDRGARV